MKTLYIVLFSTLLIISISFGKEKFVQGDEITTSVSEISAWEKFYTINFGYKHEYIPIGDIIIIKIDEKTEIQDISSFQNTFKLDLGPDKIIKISDNIFQIQGESSENLKIRNKLINNKFILSIEPNYIPEKHLNSKSNTSFGITNQILYHVSENTTEEQLLAIHKKFGLDTVKKTDEYTIVEIPLNSNIYEIATDLYNEGLFVSASPVFFLTFKH